LTTYKIIHHVLLHNYVVNVVSDDTFLYLLKNNNNKNTHPILPILDKNRKLLEAFL
jgi:hypothetical protein